MRRFLLNPTTAPKPGPQAPLLPPPPQQCSAAPCTCSVRGLKKPRRFTCSSNHAASPVMEFRFRDVDGGSRGPCDRRFMPRAEQGHFHGGPPPPPLPQTEWEAAAARRERIVREEVERRLIEEEVCRELALARARLHGGLGSEPLFFMPDGPFVPPPPGPFFGAGGPFMPPMPAGMHPNAPPPAPFGPSRRSAYGRQKLPSEARGRPLPTAKPEHKLEPGENSEVLSSETKIFGVKADVVAANTEPTLSLETEIFGVKRKADVIAATTQPTKLQKAAVDWSCALCQVRATSEASLNIHIEGKKHRAKLAQCGAIKVISGDESGSQATTGNKDGSGPSDASRKICILVDGVIHEVVQKSNYLWCERCRVRCENNITMTDHLRGKKHSELNKVWKSIRAVRLNTRSKEGSAATCNRKISGNGHIGIPEKERKEGACMTSELNDNGSVEVHVGKEEEEEVNESSITETPVEIKEEDTDIASEVNGSVDMASEVNEKNVHVEVPTNFKQERTDMVMDVNRNGFKRKT